MRDPTQRAFLYHYVAGFLANVGTWLFVFSLTTYLESSRAWSGENIASLLTWSTIAVAVFAIVSIGGTARSHRSTVRISTAVTIVGSAILLIGHDRGFFVVVGALLIAGTLGFDRGARLAASKDLWTKSQSGRNGERVVPMSSISFALARLAAALIGLLVLSHLFDPKRAVLVATVANAAAAVLVWMATPSNAVVEVAKDGLVQAAKDIRKIAIPFLTVSTLTLTYTTLIPTIAAGSSDPDNYLAVAFGAFGIGGAIGATVGVWKAAKPKQAVVVSCAFLATGNLVALVQFTSLEMAVAVFGLGGLGSGLIIPSITTWAHRLAGDDGQEKATLSIVILNYGLDFAGGLVVYFAVLAKHPEAAFGIALLGAVIGLIWFAVLGEPEKKSESPPAEAQNNQTAIDHDR